MAIGFDRAVDEKGLHKSEREKNYERMRETRIGDSMDNYALAHDVGFLYENEVHWMIPRGAGNGVWKANIPYAYDFFYIAIRDPEIDWLYMYQKMNLKARLGDALADRKEKQIVFRYEAGLLQVSVDHTSITINVNALYDAGYIEHDDTEFPDFGSTYVNENYEIQIGEMEPAGEMDFQEETTDGQSDREEETSDISPAIENYFSDVIGMASVKQELTRLHNVLVYQEEEKAAGIDQPDVGIPWNFWITGEAGSGKKMVAAIICKMLYDFGMTDEETPEELTASGIQSEPESLQGKGSGRRAVIIDHTEKLLEQPDGDSQKNVLEDDLWIYIKKCLEEADRKKDRFYIFVGKDESMQEAFEKNPHIGNLLEHIPIPKYSVDELCNLTELLCNREQYFLDSDARMELRRSINCELAVDDFANAHTLGKFIKEAKLRKVRRHTMDGEARDRIMTAADFHLEDDDPRTLEELLEELNALIGLEGVKRSVYEKIKLIEWQETQRRQGKKVAPIGLNVLFLGAPGTGKTTVARLLGQIYKKLGLLPKGQLIEADAESLKAGYQGQTAIKTKELVSKAIGGILFIDEAYNICNGENDDFGHEAVATILKLMEDNRDRMMVIMAGYEKEMNEFLRSNSGFQSRFQERILFEDYTEEQLFTIFNMYLQKYNLILSDEAIPMVKEVIGDKKRTEKENFANGRDMRTMAEALYRAVAYRIDVDSMSDEQIEVIPKDINHIKGITSNAGDQSLEELLGELDALIGLAGVKRAVHQTLDKEKRSKQRHLDAGIDYRPGNLHMLFYGNAGSGKTMVARLVGKIFAKAGLLPKADVFVEASRETLVAGFQGQTAERTKDVVRKAMGGVLFVDEAYNICNGEHDDFGHEALNELIAPLYNQKGNFMVIMAGYEDKMQELAKNNQGFDSRFPTTVYFEDYNKEELRQIFYSMVPKKLLKIEDGLEDVVEECLVKRKECILSRGADFGNARGVETFLEKIEGCQSERLGHLSAEIGEENIDDETKNTIIREDIEEAVYI